MSEIRLFAADFAPKSWALCLGQTLPIPPNAALFSLLGTTYGGDGQTTFQLPNMAGRVAIGIGQGTDAPNISMGQIGGEANHTLTPDEMPKHTHTAVISSALNAPGPAITLNATSATPNSFEPAGALMADSGMPWYADGASATVPMAATSTSSSFNLAGAGTLAIQPTGANMPHDNMQPYIAINHIICLNGYFPSRN